MGRNYSVKLYFDARRLEDALLAAAGLAVKEGDPIRVQIPSGRVLSLPFTHQRGIDPCEIRVEGSPICFDTVLTFEPDSVLASCNHLIELEYDPSRDIGPLHVGAVYLWVHLGRRYVELQFQAATSVMSLMLLQSPSVRARFSSLLRDAGGLAAIIDLETDDFRVLDHPSSIIHVNRRAHLDDDYDPDDGGTDYDVDSFTEAVLKTYPAVGPLRRG